MDRDETNKPDTGRNLTPINGIGLGYNDEIVRSIRREIEANQINRAIPRKTTRKIKANRKGYLILSPDGDPIAEVGFGNSDDK